MADLLTTAQAAEILGKSISTVNYRVRVGELQYAQKLPGLSGAYLFDRKVIEAARKADSAAAQRISA